MRQSANTVVVLHNPVPPNAPPDDLDTLDQVMEIENVLRELGYRVLKLNFSCDIAPLRHYFEAQKPVFVFNLVESVDGDGSLIHLAPALLEQAKMKYTGCTAESFFTTTHKVLAKKLLRHDGLPTPGWVVLHEPGSFVAGCPYIIKPESEDASIGIDPDSVVFDANRRDIETILRHKQQTTGRVYFAEQYVDGREFNISLLANGAEPEVLQPIELIFTGSATPHIFHYKAKWKEHYPEYAVVEKKMDFPGKDAPLLNELRRLALACWQTFHLRGYARIDFRIDRRGKPWVIEINGNPALSADSNFEVAAKRGGLDMAGIVKRIVADIPDILMSQ